MIGGVLEGGSLKHDGDQRGLVLHGIPAQVLHLHVGKVILVGLVMLG